MNLLEFIEMLEPTKDDVRWAKDWLGNTRYLVETLGNTKYFPPHKVLLLLKYEMEGMCRLSLVKRLHGRYGRLRMLQEWEHLKHYMERNKNDAGKSY